MNQIALIFDAEDSRDRKRVGMARAATNRNVLLDKAREIARYLAERDGETNADAVSQELMQRGYPDCLGPAAGSIFKTSDWVFTGRFVNSARVTNHSRLLRVRALRNRDSGEG